MLSVTLMHPAKVIGQNEMPFDRDAHVVPSNVVLDWGPSPPWEGEIWGSEPSVCNDVTCCQITLAVVLLLGIDTDALSVL